VHTRYTHRSSALPGGGGPLGVFRPCLTTKGSWIHLWRECRQAFRQPSDTSTSSTTDKLPAMLTSCVGGRHNMPPPLQADLWPFDLESGVSVTCDVGYLCTNFCLHRPLCSRLRPDVHDTQTDVRQTSEAHHRLMPPRYGARA